MYTQLSLIEGNPIGEIKGGSMNGKVIKLKKSDNKENQEFKLKDGEIIPYHIKQLNGEFPNRCVITGPSLCGKSYFAKMLADDYYDNYRQDGHRIILFTAIPRFKDNIFACDECRNKDEDDKNKRRKKIYRCMCSKIYRIKCDESILTDPIDLHELSNSLCIFDDIDRHPNKEVAKELNLLRDKIMNSGRHDNIDLLSISQILLDGKKTKTSLTNAFQIVAFPVSGGRYQLKEFLKRYMSLEHNQIEKVLNLPSRWIILNNCEPMYVLHQRGCFIL